MKKFFSKFFAGDSSSSAGASFQSSKSAGNLTSELENATPYVLYVREKVGAAFGGTRYIIGPKSTQSVAKVDHTFYRLLIYAYFEPTADPEVGKASASSAQMTQEAAPKSNLAATQNAPKNKETRPLTDTGLSIDSDMICDYDKIVISYDGFNFSLDTFNPRGLPQ